MLRLITLKDFGDAEQDEFARNTGHDLQADGQSGARKSAGDGNGRNTCEIGRTIVPQQQSARRIFVRSDADGFLIESRSLNCG